MSCPIYQPLPPFGSFLNLTLYAMLGGTLPPITHNIGLYSSAIAPMEQAMTKKFTDMEAMIQWIPKVPIPLKKS